jgi:hypothetical protein
MAVEEQWASDVRAGLRRAVPHLLVGVWMLLVALYATWPLAAHAGSQVAGNLGDPLEIAWRFAWAAHAVVHQPRHLFDANMFSPERLTLALSENHLGVSLPLAPIFWVTHNAVLVLNVEILLVLAAAGFGVYLLVWEATHCREAAVVAGTAYTGAGFRIASVNLGHVHTLALHLAPFVLLALLRLRRNQSWRPVALLAVFVGLQWWSSLTGGLQTMIAIAVWGVWELARFRRQAWPQLWRAGLGIFVGLLLAVPVLWPYFEFRQEHRDFTHPSSEAIELSATPGSYLSPEPVGKVVGGLYRELSERFRDSHSPGEKELFPGLWLSGGFVAAAAGAAVVVVRRHTRGAMPSAPQAQPAPWSWVEATGLFVAITFTAFVLSLGPNLGATPDGPPLPFKALTALIPGGLMRVPARVGALTLLGMAVTAGIGLSRPRLGRRHWLVGISLLVLGLELLPPRLGLVTPPTITSANRVVANQPGAVLALPTIQFAPDGALIYDFDTIIRETQNLYLSTAHFRPLINGYGYLPSVYLEVARAAADLPSPAAFKTLDGHGVRTIIVQRDLVLGTRWAGIETRLRDWPGVRELASTAQASAFDVSHASTTAPEPLNPRYGTEPQKDQASHR